MQNSSFCFIHEVFFGIIDGVDIKGNNTRSKKTVNFSFSVKRILFFSKQIQTLHVEELNLLIKIIFKMYIWY